MATALPPPAKSGQESGETGALLGEKGTSARLPAPLSTLLFDWRSAMLGAEQLRCGLAPARWNRFTKVSTRQPAKSLGRGDYRPCGAKCKGIAHQRRLAIPPSSTTNLPLVTHMLSSVTATKKARSQVRALNKRWVGLNYFRRRNANSAAKPKPASATADGSGTCITKALATPP